MSSNPFFYQAIAGPSRPPPVSVADVAAPDSASRTFFVQRPTQWTLHGMAPNLPSAGGHRPTNSPCHDVGPVGSPSSPRPEAPRRSSSLSTLVNAWEPNDTKGMYDDTMIWFGEEEVLELKTPKLESVRSSVHDLSSNGGARGDSGVILPSHSAERRSASATSPVEDGKSSPLSEEKTRKRRRRNGETPRDEARRKYVCPFKDCSSKFARPSALQIHSFTHSKVKAFECETCSQSFSVQSNLRRHEKLHTRAGSVELEPV